MSWLFLFGKWKCGVPFILPTFKITGAEASGHFGLGGKFPVHQQARSLTPCLILPSRWNPGLQPGEVRGTYKGGAPGGSLLLILYQNEEKELSYGS
jgi:hypothetical protein